MERGDCFNQLCVTREVLGHVTSRWGVLVIAALRDGTLRFSAIRLRVGGISEKMLAQTLRDLTRDGLVVRTSHAVVPPRVDYALTGSGFEVSTRLWSLIAWLEEHVRDLLLARREHDETRTASEITTAKEGEERARA